MFFSTASALKSSRSASRHVMSRLSESARTSSHTLSKLAGTAGSAHLRWMANTPPLSSPIRSRTFGSDATAKPES